MEYNDNDISQCVTFSIKRLIINDLLELRSLLLLQINSIQKMFHDVVTSWTLSVCLFFYTVSTLLPKYWYRLNLVIPSTSEQTTCWYFLLHYFLNTADSPIFILRSLVDDDSVDHVDILHLVIGPKTNRIFTVKYFLRNTCSKVWKRTALTRYTKIRLDFLNCLMHSLYMFIFFYLINVNDPVIIAPLPDVDIKNSNNKNVLVENLAF